MPELTISQFETRMPKTNDDYFNNLSEERKEMYLKLYVKYSNLLYKYLIDKLDLKEYDNLIAKSNNNFVEVPIDKLDMYQYLGKSYLKYFYLRNNLYIERLSEEELDFLMKKNNDDLDQDTITFIESTYQKVMLESNNDININYGPDSASFYKPSNNIIIGVRFDDYYQVEKSEEEWNVKYNDRLYELDLITSFLARKLESFKVPCSVIIYNDFSIKRLTNVNLKSIN